MLYIDCYSGISAGMLLAGLVEIAEKMGIKCTLPEIDGSAAECERSRHGSSKNEEQVQDNHVCSNDEEHAHKHHGRSYNEVREMIRNAEGVCEEGKKTAMNIYEAIAKAEASVHGKTLETVHFHEVGRDKAVENALGIGAVLEEIEETEILISPIYDGTGFVDCAHGRIPVPVPAVQAMKTQCPEYEFRTAEEVKTEMVTPSGLAALIGIGARPASEEEKTKVEAAEEWRVLAHAEAKGTRDTGRGGLKIMLIISDAR